MSSADLPPVYRALVAHLDALLSPSGPDTDPRLLDPALFDRAELELDRHDKAALAMLLLPRIVGVLRLDPPVQLPPTTDTTTTAATARQPADLLAALATRLLAPATFADLLQLAPETALVEALAAQAAPATNLLALAVVHKAAKPESALHQLAAMDRLLEAVVVRWLASPDVAVGERGLAVLGDLLDVDCPREVPPPPPILPKAVNGSAIQVMMALDKEEDRELGVPILRTRPGPGLLWKKFFAGETASALKATDNSTSSLSALAVALATGRHPATAHQPRQQSLATDRLLRLLPRVAALDLRRVAADSDGGGLLLFAARDLVALDGPARDELLVRARDHFFAVLVDALWAVVLVDDKEEPEYVTATLKKVLATRALAPEEPLAVHLRSLPDAVAPERTALARAWLEAVLPSPDAANDDDTAAEQTFVRLLAQYRQSHALPVR